MNNKTKKIFILSSGIVVATIFVLVFVIFKIQSQGVHLEEQINTKRENDKKELTYIALKRKVLETESRRALLADSFFKNKGDSINFLGDIESLATSVGLSLKIDKLEEFVDTETKQESIRIYLTYFGQKDLVFNFSKLMEVTPYHSRIESLAVKKYSDKEWQGDMLISITINSL